MSGQPEFPPHVLREYALLADGERGAIIGPRGDIAWMCVPRWDSPSVFSALLGGTGVYAVTPVESYVWGGHYEGTSMIWRNRWVTRGGIVECREALAYPPDPERAVLLRQVHAVDAPARVRVTLHPRGGYDRAPLSDLHRRDGVWTAKAGKLRLRWTGATEARTHGHRERLVLDVVLRAGEKHNLVLEISGAALPDDLVDPDGAWRATEIAWEQAVPRLDGCLAQRETRRSYAVLRGLTSLGGGMVAAATTSLPERAEAGRNYDYRYVWIRDQCYAGQAIAAAAPDPLLDDAVSFVAARLNEHGDQLAPAYTTAGDTVPSPRHIGLPGYPGGADVVGNSINQQFQLDAFGEALYLFAAAAKHDRLDGDHWQAVRAAAGGIARRWSEPDAGIWEIEPRAWTHSRLTAAGGLRTVASLRPNASESAEWISLADKIVADTTANALNPAGHWQRAADDPSLDGSLLLAGLRCAVPPDDPRTVSTLRAYLEQLASEGYAYRFRHDERPLADAEGSFLLCGYLVALALHQQGEKLAARGWYERTRAACGPPELFSEEFDVGQHQLRGNLPQAFVHALMLECSIRLAE